MRFKIKLLDWPDAGHHAVVIAQGLVDIDGVGEILRAIARATETLQDCKVLIDFEDAECSIGVSDICARGDSLRPQKAIQEKKIALVSGTDKKQHAKLLMLSTCLWTRGFKVAVFQNPKEATVWLAERVKDPQ
jgi:hypothetical protein